MEYNKFSQYLRNKFGCKVYKVSVEAGFSCPNIDGTKSSQGCIFCNNETFSYNFRQKDVLITDQLLHGMLSAKQTLRAEKFIAYFQSFSNTYASIERLKEVYDNILEFEDIVMLNIGTRPDCLDLDKINLINSYTDKREVWLEIGLQSSKDKTLQIINRHHTKADFENIVRIIKLKSNIKVCAHVILGLPFEREQDIIDTANFLSDIGIDGVKIHPIHVVKGTALEKMYLKGDFRPIDMNRYVSWVCKFIQHLPENTIIHRITADCHPSILIAPKWIKEKNRLLNAVDDF